MKVVITGGCGFLAQQLAAKLLAKGSLVGLSGSQEEIERLVLFDAPTALAPRIEDPRLEVLRGDIAESAHVRAFCDRDDVSVFHMASIMSGGGEADFDLAMQVNVEGARNVLEALRARAVCPRFVFTSAVSVFGGRFVQESVGDSTKQTPQTTYGTTKAMVELLVNDYTRKGFLDGRVARLPTIIVRPGSPNAAASSFTSAVVREPYQGIDLVVPVPMTTTMAVMGHRTVIDCLIALHDLEPSRLGEDRAVELPSMSVTLEELYSSLQTLSSGRALGTVTEKPDADIERIVATWPTRTSFERATALGLPMDDDVDGIVRAFIEDFGD